MADNVLDPTPEGEALYELLVQLPQLTNRLRALRSDGDRGWGEGMRGFLRGLRIDGPRTVPRIARTRHVARQRIQKLADHAAELGLVEFRDNPDHRRSRIVALTREGRGTVRDLDRAMRAMAERFAPGLDVRDLDVALRVVFELTERLGEAKDRQH
jgi:DNA-binding MarR family transcriptional regulator